MKFMKKFVAFSGALREHDVQVGRYFAIGHGVVPR